MRIIVATSDVPFVEGGHRVIARALVRELKENGYEAELWCTAQNRFGKQLSAYLSNFLIDLKETGEGDKIDFLISFRYPSFAIRHPNHICWLSHRMREYYDLWQNFKSEISFLNKIKESIRRFIIHRLDNYFLKYNVKKLFAQSKNIQKRLLDYGNIKSELLYPPPVRRNYHCRGYENFILIPSRLHPLKRVDLAIRSLALAENKELKLVIVGEGRHYGYLLSLAKELGIDERIEFLGWVEEEKLVELYSKCLAVFYAPFNEDYGLVSLEAFSSSKALITCKDSGGVPELVQDGVSGFITEPDPISIAAVFDRVSDKKLAESTGKNAFKTSLEITWEKTIKRLLNLNKDD